MQRNHKLQRTYLLNVIIVNLISVTFLGSIWVCHEFWQYKSEIKILKNDYTENLKIIVKNEVENAISYIDNINKDTEAELINSLKLRSTEVFQVINSIHHCANKRINIRADETIKNLLLRINGNKQKSHIFIISNNKLDDLNSDNKSQTFLPKDSVNKQQIIEKSATLIKTGEGLFRHKWICSNKHKHSELVAYVKYFDNLKWTIGVVIDYDEFISSRQKDVILRLSHIRFGRNRSGYLFANLQNADPLFTNGIVTVGQPNNWNLEDPYGVKIMQLQHKAAQKPDGDYIQYSWRKLFTIEEKAYGFEKATSKKISYVKGYKPWNWMIGAGFYLDDLDVLIYQKRLVLYDTIRNHGLVIALTFIISILVSLLTIKFIYHKINFNFKRFISFFDKATTGTAKLVPEILYYQEFKDLAVYANKMVEQRELAEQGFKQIVEVFPYPICLFKKNKVLYLNPQWINLIGYNVTEIPSLSRALIICFPDLNQRHLLQQLKNGDTINNVDKIDTLFHILCKDGQTRYMKLNYIEMKDSRSMITLEDYSDRKKIEDEMNAARIKAEESDKLKSAFLANMSHEIRTPMNAIIGFSGLLQKNTLTEEKRNTYLSYILKSSDSLMHLINDILDISKIEAGELKFLFVWGNLESVFSALDAEIKGIQLTLNKMDVRIISTYNLRNNQGTLETDFLRLKQVLMNLLSNALKFTTCGSIEYGCTVKDPDTLQFYVRDTGIGIKPNHIKQIFNRFTKIEENHTQIFRGAGLGLAISKKLVEAMGGTIWVESEYGVGSTFYFTLPYKLSHKS